jgi:hypothetical protein
MSTNSPRGLSDDQLVEEVKRLALFERRATAALIRALIEFDARKLHLREGCPSLFAYCTQQLHLSEASAFNRIETARAARRFPALLEAIDGGTLTLTAVRLLAPHLTAENHHRVLAQAAHRSRREVEEMVAALNPQPPAPALIRRVTSAHDRSTQAGPEITQTQAERADSARRLSDACASPEDPGADCGAASVATICSENEVGPGAAGGVTSRPVLPALDNVARHPPLTSAVVRPVAPELYRLHVTLSAAAYEKLGRAQRLLRHTLPSGDPAEILERALTLLVEHLERRRFAEVTLPREPRGPRSNGGPSRHIPAAVRRAVWHRDEGRCAFVGRSGRCRETAFLEFHHVKPHAAGGPPTEDNIQLRCRAHNQYEAELFFGAEVLREQSPPWGLAG